MNAKKHTPLSLHGLRLLFPPLATLGILFLTEWIARGSLTGETFTQYIFPHAEAYLLAWAMLFLSWLAVDWLDDGEGAFARYAGEFEEYRSLSKELGMPEQQVVINEYATMEACGVPGILIRYIAMLEENNASGCLPFWHQANNLNDLAADANEPNSAWWFYKWYAQTAFGAESR